MQEPFDCTDFTMLLESFYHMLRIILKFTLKYHRACLLFYKTKKETSALSISFEYYTHATAIYISAGPLMLLQQQNPSQFGLQTVSNFTFFYFFNMTSECNELSKEKFVGQGLIQCISC